MAVCVCLNVAIYSVIMLHNFSLGPIVYWLWWPSLTKDLQTEPQKRVPCVGVVGQTQSVWFTRTNVFQFGIKYFYITSQQYHHVNVAFWVSCEVKNLTFNFFFSSIKMPPLLNWENFFLHKAAILFFNRLDF